MSDSIAGSRRVVSSVFLYPSFKFTSVGCLGGGAVLFGVE
jgi:hypothetical protein